MSRIQLLSQNLINLIAAGEVVERPASALKEMLENSIDAGSDEIIVKIEESGIKTISIKDNGIGMNKDDAVLAFKQHATSKIKNADDLQKIMTMGFRGEALASISSVSESIEVETKEENGQPVKLLIQQDKITNKTSGKTANGTYIKINNLFENVPARKKFLKAPATELKYIFNTFLETALVHLNIHFEIYNNDKLVYKLTKTNDLKSRLFEIWGSAIAKNIIDPVTVDHGSYQIEYYIGVPEIGRKTNSHQFVYVNNRFVNSKLIASAAQEAFRGFIHKDLKPVYFIVIHINPTLVDVNIHPRKLEIKFQNSEEIFKSVMFGIKKILEKTTRTMVVDSLPNNNIDPIRPTYSFESTRKESFTPTQRYEANYKPERSSVNSAISFTQALMSPVNNGSEDKANVQNTNYNETLPYQLFNTYILLENNNKLVVIDQHAAAEKILFEKLINDLGHVTRKPFLIPQIIELSNTDKGFVLANKNAFEEIGVIIEDFGSNSIQVLEIPEILEMINIEHYIEKIVRPDSDLSNSFHSFETYNGIKLTQEIYMLLATTACHGSIRAGQKLSANEMKNLLTDFYKLHNPYNCPHGRPTIWEIDRYDLEKNFKRKL